MFSVMVNTLLNVWQMYQVPCQPAIAHPMLRLPGTHGGRKKLVFYCINGAYAVFFFCTRDFLNQNMELVTVHACCVSLCC